jgi:quercetin dioxygenase-like cupin family protein
MPVVRYDDLDLQPVIMDGVRGASKAVPLGAKDWPDHVVRVFRIRPGGYTPRHSHDWEHVNFVIKGRGRLTIDGQPTELGEKDFAYVPPNTMHQFENPYDSEFEFICIVPERGEY